MREETLLQHVYRASHGLPDLVEVGPGDDMAVLDLDGTSLLVAVDQLVDGRHVDLRRITFRDAGRKAIARSASDIAAMAAHPLASLAAVTLPSSMSETEALELFEGMRAGAAEFGCPLVGGDIAIHEGGTDHPLTCAVTVLARRSPHGVRTRAEARVGDAVYVTGELGGTLDPDGGGHHLSFAPRIPEGLDLAAGLGSRLHAMMDVSDGLGRDAARMAIASHVRIEIDAAAIPCRNGLPWRRGAGDGEDYELLFTADGAVPTSVGRDVVVTRIGRVIDEVRSGASVVFVDGDERIDGDDLGWEHRS